ncbi:MAG: hypothetical protein FWF18_02560 [Dehalococcoidia bacterium]|nr:hypothetical protein [Dehalococcoidia bacterium]
MSPPLRGDCTLSHYTLTHNQLLVTGIQSSTYLAEAPPVWQIVLILAIWTALFISLTFHVVQR